ncbi:MAG: helix-turn-helix domain-containing protein, partial [bacterium]|nr:helix-turn-helix domain-containing protein [bacterium]
QDHFYGIGYERFNHPHLRVQRKAEAVLLKSRGLKHKDICGITGICGSTLRSYLQDYADGGIECLGGGSNPLIRHFPNNDRFQNNNG